MKRIFTLGLLVTTAALFLIGCEKCELPDNSQSGEILDHVVLKDLQSSITDFDEILIDDSLTNSLYESVVVSFDNGMTYDEIDFTNYSLLGINTSTTCSATFNRTLDINLEDSTAVYSLRINECEDCDFTVSTQNWVLTPKIPDYVTTTFVVTR